MSIATKKGDGGMTSLIFNRRVPKTHPRIEALGTVDELNATLGLVRASLPASPTAERLLQIQHHLVVLMGELATLPEDLARLAGAGFSQVAPAMTATLQAWVDELEARKEPPKDWAYPGTNLASANLDVARTVCRRAERRICLLQESGELPNAEVIVFLNRLSDLLWLLARQVEQPEARNRR